MNLFLHLKTDFDKFSITSLAHQWILCSEWVPSEWESKQLIQNTIPVTLSVKSCKFVRNKSIIKTLKLYNHFESIIQNNASSSEKVHPLLSSQIKVHPHICLECFLPEIYVYFSPDSEMTFSLEKAILRIEDYYFSHKWQFEVKSVLMMDLLLTNMQLYTSQDINWWTGVVWITVMFVSAVWTLILTAPIHCKGSIGEQVI